MCKFMYKFIILLVVAYTSQFSFAASFDCAKASSPMEILVCSDENLSKMDENLAIVYEQALSLSDSKDIIVQWQREWIRTVSDYISVEMLTRAYEERIRLLDRVAPPSEETSRWTGRYVLFEDGYEYDNYTLLLIGLIDNRVYILGNGLWIDASGTCPHMGIIDTIGVVFGEKIFFLEQESDCTGLLALSKEGVVVEEESGCGGMNVSFIGEYRRK